MMVSEAQADLRHAYVGGGPGVAISGLVWLTAAWVQHAHGTGAGFAALFGGGTLIFVATKLVCRTLFRRPNESAANPFGPLVLEGTIAMIAGLFAAWLFLPLRPRLVFAVAAIVVGTHYFVFRTAYGDRRFWLLASVVTAAGCAAIFIPAVQAWVALAVGIVEIVGGAALTAVCARPRARPGVGHV